MALPIVHSLPECASYAKVIEPCIDQLYALPSEFAEAARASLANAFSASSLSEIASEAAQPFARLYVHTNPLVSGFAISLALGAVFLVVSEINRNYSQVDRCWSLLPTLYIAHFNLWARLQGLSTEKLDAALLFGVAWSVSLIHLYFWLRRASYCLLKHAPIHLPSCLG